MSLTPQQIDKMAIDILSAEVSHDQIGLLTERHPSMDMDDAYAVQKSILEQKQKLGRKIIGWKIGLTSKAMQYALNIDIPDSGILFDDMLFENNARIPKDRFIQPRVEAEIAFVMRSPLSGANVTRNDVINATDYVTPSLEILDTRILRVSPTTKKTRTVIDTIADNAANAGIVLGDKKHKISEFDLRWVGAIASRNGEVEETGLGAGVLNDPIMGIVWLAKRMSAYNMEIKAGDIILSGSFIRPIETMSGALIEADFKDFGSVTCKFD